MKSTLTINEKINAKSYFSANGNKYHYRSKEVYRDELPYFSKTDRPFIESGMFYILINKQASKACIRKFSNN